MTANRPPPLSPARYRQLNRLSVAKARAQWLARTPWQLPDEQRTRLLRGLAAIDQALTAFAREFTHPPDEDEHDPSGEPRSATLRDA